jgi:DNA topoisomerase-1
VHVATLDPKRHETTPPARYTEASLIKELERLGIGRPSTYASTIGTIERRGYIFRQGKALVPSFTAFAVTRLLVTHFGDLVDVEFTAEMEEDLDQISRGEREWLDFIKQFYRGDRHHRGLEEAVRQAEERADYPLIDVGVDPRPTKPCACASGATVPFLQMGEGRPGKTASLPPDTGAGRPDGWRKRWRSFAPKPEGAAQSGRRSEDRHERLRHSTAAFGAYVQLGETPDKGSKDKPKRSSLTNGLTESTVSLR